MTPKVLFSKQIGPFEIVIRQMAPVVDKEDMVQRQVDKMVSAEPLPSPPSVLEAMRLYEEYRRGVSQRQAVQQESADAEYQRIKAELNRQ